LTALFRAQAGELFFVEGVRSGEPRLGAVSEPFTEPLEALRIVMLVAELTSFLGGLERTALGPAPGCAELRAALSLSADEAYAFDLALRSVKVGLILREARARGPHALRAAAFAIFVGLAAGAFVDQSD
jgi:hypothetical protein